MPKKFNLSQFFIVLLVICSFTKAFSQTNSQVFIVDVNENIDGFEFTNFRRVSTEEGYNNQPFFKDNTTLLYAKNSEGQTDIGVYNLSENSETFWNPKTEGGEYSPQSIPGSDAIAAVRLDPDGLQRLYRYNENGNFEEIIPNAVVAYFTFYDANTIVSSVIVNEDLHLVVYYLKEQQSYKLLQGSGRAFQKTPNSKAVSYTAVNEDKNYDVYQLDMEGLESFFVVQLPIGVQDLVWYNDSKIIIGSDAQLFMYDLYGDGDWKKIADFSDKKITNITRLAVSPDASKLAFVAETKP